jgi:hypothetical protein
VYFTSAPLLGLLVLLGSLKRWSSVLFRDILAIGFRIRSLLHSVTHSLPGEPGASALPAAPLLLAPFSVSEGVDPSTRYSVGFFVIRWAFHLLAS